MSARMDRGWSPAMPAGALAILVAVTAGGYLVDRYKDRLERQNRAELLTGGSIRRGKMQILRYGCAGCHTIEGIPHADGLVGPPLTTISRRVYVAGMLKNTPDNLARWIVDPRGINPQTAMPVTGISPAEARDVVAYLYAHD
ncbi:c-type cytochrome [Microvirga thermotolerans]|nr:c-type cytochrome [Microvirga thermotolerans]